MLDIDLYLDEAKKKQGIKSDRQLAMHLGLDPSATSPLRRKISLPSDETMVKIAEAAGKNPVIALIELSEARNFDNPAATIYQQMKTALVSGKKIASYGLVAGAMGMGVGVDFEPTATAEEWDTSPGHNFILWEILN